MPCVLCYVCSRGCQAEVGVWCRRKGWGTESPLPVEGEGAVLLPGLGICVLYPGVYWELVLGTPELLWALCFLPILSGRVRDVAAFRGLAEPWPGRCRVGVKVQGGDQGRGCSHRAPGLCFGAGPPQSRCIAGVPCSLQRCGTPMPEVTGVPEEERDVPESRG